MPSRLSKQNLNFTLNFTGKWEQDPLALQHNPLFEMTKKKKKSYGLTAMEVARRKGL